MPSRRAAQSHTLHAHSPRACRSRNIPSPEQGRPRPRCRTTPRVAQQYAVSQVDGHAACAPLAQCPQARRKAAAVDLVGDDQSAGPRPARRRASSCCPKRTQVEDVSPRSARPPTGLTNCDEASCMHGRPRRGTESSVGRSRRVVTLVRGTTAPVRHLEAGSAPGAAFTGLIRTDTGGTPSSAAAKRARPSPHPGRKEPVQALRRQRHPQRFRALIASSRAQIFSSTSGFDTKSS